MSEPKDLVPQFLADALADSEDPSADAYELAGALSHAFEQRPPSALRARLLETVARSDERYAPFWQRLGEMFDLPLDKMRRVLTDLHSPERWQPAPIPGVSLLHFDGGPQVAAADCGLVRLEPGTPFPEHSHLGRELVLVLAGGYREHTGKTYTPGDAHEMQPGTAHSLRADAEHGCLFAVLLRDGIEIQGVGRLGGT